MSLPDWNPINGNDDMKIRLTDASANVLVKVPELKRWSVQPTMTRGARKVAQKVAQKINAKKLKSKNVKKGLKLKCKKARKAKKKSQPKVVKLDVSEISPASFRRTIEGRGNVTYMLRQIVELDEKAFPLAPAWGPTGTLRMKFEGADQFQLEKVLEAAPKAIEYMFLASMNSWWGCEPCFL